MSNEPNNPTDVSHSLGANLRGRLRIVMGEAEIQHYAPLINKIQRLKKEKNAVILAHNYQTPEIYHGVADIVGDSLALAAKAKEVSADTIVLCGVHFMAETAKILNPSKRVLIPDTRAGCSLAESITAQNVRDLRAKYPGIPVVTYVNTSAEVKAEVDICCTSSNAVQIVESLDSNKVIFLPDEFLGKWVQTQTDKELILWNGHCEVHEKFSENDMLTLRANYPNAEILAHPECPPEVLAHADFVGSTAAMIKHAHECAAKEVALITECSMSDNVSADLPGKKIIRPCNLCPHMKRITLENIVTALEKGQYEIEIEETIRERALLSVERMLAVSAKKFQQ